VGTGVRWRSLRSSSVGDEMRPAMCCGEIVDAKNAVTRVASYATQASTLRIFATILSSRTGLLREFVETYPFCPHSLLARNKMSASGTKRTCRAAHWISALGGKVDYCRDGATVASSFRRALSLIPKPARRAATYRLCRNRRCLVPPERS
jgi:hypothetical protein